MKCPICGSENVSRSHRKGMERISRYISLRTPYRCKECWSRFWRFENPFSSTAGKIGGICIVCLLIAGLGWYLLPRKDETSWQAVQQNVRAVPEPRVQESATIKSPEPQPRTDSVKTQETAAETAEIPEEAKSGSENGKAEPTVTGDHSDTPAEVILPAEVSKPDSESRDNEAFPALSEKEEKSVSPAGSGSEETEIPDLPEKKGESDKISLTGGQESPKTGAASAPESVVFPAGTESAENPAPKSVPEKIRSEHTEKPHSSDAESLQPGKKETDQTAAGTAPPVPEPVPAVTIAPAKLISEPVSFRKLKTVKTESGKEAFEVHILADGPVPQYTFFSLPTQSPPKLVVDLPGKWKYEGPLSFRVKDAVVLQVRLGKHKDFFRVVLDLKIRVPVQPVFSETDEGLTVILNRKAE